MNKIVKIVLLVILILIIAVIVAGYTLKPVGHLEKRLNAQIAENLKENNVGLEIVLYNMVYDFPWKFEALGYIKSEDYDLLIQLEPIKLVPHIGTLFSRTRVFDMKGDALGGWFSGSFALGANENFQLKFDRLQTKVIKYASTGEPLSENLDIVLSGKLQIHDEYVGADAEINSARISLPEPLNVTDGILFFYNGRVNFEIVDNEFILKDALLESEDVSLVVKGHVCDLDTDERYMDFNGTLFVHNQFLAALLNLWSPQGDTPEFKFNLSGPADDPKFKFIGPDGKAIELMPSSDNNNRPKVTEEDSNALLESIDIPSFEEEED